MEIKETLMIMKRRIARERALQALFQIDVSKTDPEEAINNVSEEDDPFLRQLVFGTVEHLSEIDSLIEENLEYWTLDRLGNVDRALLRMAVYEMKYLEDIPFSVSMDEAVEIAKIYGDEKSGKFINGVLSKIKDALS
jgi:transcription antitermination protein NusB